MKIVNKIVSIFLIGVLLVSLAACGGTDSSNTASTASSSSEGTATASSSVAAAKDPLGKYDPAIEISLGKVIQVGTTFENGDTIDNNVWTRGYLNELGIKVTNEWTVDDAKKEEKINVVIASGEIPDIMMVNAKQLKQLVDADMIQDLTQVYNDYASPLTKEVMSSDGGISMNASTVKGKLMALPWAQYVGNGNEVLWVRGDWLKKLGLSAPKTMDDVFKISEAFTSNDPDGNSKDDTYGLAVTKEAFDKDYWWTTGNLTGFLNSYHAYPDTWIKDSSGQLVYGGIQPEIKPALAKLQELYKAGLIDKEFAVKDWQKTLEAIKANKIGMTFFNEGFPWQIQSMYLADKTIDWIPCALPSIDSDPAKFGMILSCDIYFVVKKDIKNPEAAVKMMNMAVDKQFGEKGRVPEYFASADNTIGYAKYAALYTYNPMTLLQIYKDVEKGLETKDTTGMTWDGKDNYERILRHLNNTPKDESDAALAWATYKWSGPNGGMSVVSNYWENKLYVADAFYGPVTPSMAAKKPSLDKMKSEVFTKIIMGAVSVDEFDKFVSDWKKLGGDDITKEVNDWAASVK